MQANGRRIVTITVYLLLFLMLVSPSASAVDHTTHYTKILLYDKWPISYDDFKHHVKYYYSQSGTYDYSDNIDWAAVAWEYCDDHSPFSIYQVYGQSSANLMIESGDYGNTGWYGLTDPRGSIKEIQLNEWYEEQGAASHRFYDLVMVHEMGHTHGLNHHSCTSEYLSTAATADWPYIGDVAGSRISIRSEGRCNWCEDHYL